MATTENDSLRHRLLEGAVIPAMPLALREDRTWSPRHQRALARYFLESGAGGIAVGVHSTQFEIRAPEHSLFEPVLRLCAEEIAVSRGSAASAIAIAGVCGDTPQAVREAELARELGYDSILLSLTALSNEPDGKLLEHTRALAEILPVTGFYLQPTIGGRDYSFDFWRRFLDLPNVVAIKVAPFDRYATLDVVRALACSGREDVALYTGNDDNIIHDLVSEFSFEGKTIRFSGGLLGQWAIGTRRAVALLREIRAGEGDARSWARRNAELTDLNSAVFDPHNDFAGCLPGINEMLRRPGLLPSNACLDPSECLSPGQGAELDRVSRAYPHWLDEDFIKTNLARWLGE